MSFYTSIYLHIYTCAHNILSLATSALTSFWSISAGSNWVLIKWKSTMNPPFWVKQSTSCRTMQSSEPYFVDAKILKPTVNSIVQNDLKEWSICNFSITAVYNPATLDQGKSIYVFTSETAVYSVLVEYFKHYHCKLYKLLHTIIVS